MDNIIIIGSGGHAKVVMDIVRKEAKFRIAGLLDENRAPGEHTLDCPILGQLADLPGLIRDHDLKGAIIAIGDNFIRCKTAAQTKEIAPDLPLISAIHPDSSIASDVAIGEGTVIMAGVTVNSSSSIGRACILNTNCSLDHDSTMADFASLAPGVVTGGNCQIGRLSAIGIGAVLIQGINVGEHSIVGAGSLVLKSIDSFVVAYGTPAKTIRALNPADQLL